MKHSYAIIASLVLVVLAYSNHFSNTFHFDDSHTIQNNLAIREISNIPKFFFDATTSSSLPPNQGYRPIVTTSLAFDYWLGGGLEPWAFHTSMFLVYLAQLALMYLLYRLIARVEKAEFPGEWFALFAAVFYGVHTANAETINYIISRSDSFSTFFIIAALLSYAINFQNRKRHFSLIFLLLGMLTKEATVVFPALLFAFNLLILRLGLKRSVIEAIPSSILCGISLFVSFALAPDWQAGGGDRLAYLITQLFVISHYVSTYFIPINLSADSDFGLINNPLDIRALYGVGVILILCGLGAKAAISKAYRPCAFGMAWFFIALAPTSSIMPLAEVQNDHRIFFPFVGMNLAVWWAIFTWIWPKLAGVTDRRVVSVLFCILVSAHAFGTYQRNKVWHTEESLWRDVTIKSPTNGRGLMNYGLALMSRGDLAGAKSYFERAKQFVPYYAYLYVNLGVVNGAMKNNAEAESAFKEALGLRPDISETYTYYARWLNDQGRSKEAEYLLSKALSISPSDAFAREELSRTHQLLLENSNSTN